VGVMLDYIADRSSLHKVYQHYCQDGLPQLDMIIILWGMLDYIADRSSLHKVYQHYCQDGLPN
jgi:hypothetical protein